MKPARLVVAAIGADEFGIGEQPLEIGAHLFAADRAGIARKSRSAIGNELIEVVSHGVLPDVSRSAFSRKGAPDASGLGCAFDTLRDQRRHDLCVVAVAAQARNHAGLVDRRPVLADFPFAFDARDRNFDADDAL